MTFGSSMLLLVIVIALIGVLAVVWFAPRGKGRPRRDKESQESLEPVSDPPTITHYGHA